MRALDASRQRLAANGIHEPRHLDMWTALTTGMVDQQISNDPGGTRWSALIEEVTDMFLAHCQTNSGRAPVGHKTKGRGDNQVDEIGRRITRSRHPGRAR